jgi:hypothetical protein
MHAAYGIKEGHKCRNCSNFHVEEYHNRKYYKCAAYGITFDYNTDWRANFTACGFYNNPMDGWTPLYDKIRQQKSDGQIAMEVHG